ncbi:MAG: hypothetical protein ACRDPA_27685 [Solirubrobacteraceae bacterium]
MEDRPKGLSASWWGAQALIVGGGTIYLAILGHYGWLILGIPAGAWLAKRALDAERRYDAWLRAHPGANDDITTSL